MQDLKKNSKKYFIFLLLPQVVLVKQELHFYIQ